MIFGQPAGVLVSRIAAGMPVVLAAKRREHNDMGRRKQL